MKSMKICTTALAILALASSAPAAPDGVKVIRDLPYVENGHQRNKLDLYLPENAKQPLPVVIWIHGGAWQSGSKDGCRADWLSGKGYAVASINYRLSQHAVFPAQIEDCKAAIRWLRANAAKYHLDADHIGVWGASAGGHLVALLGTSGGAKDLEGKGGNADQSSRVQCVVDWFGPTDLTTMATQDDKPDTPVAKLLGGTVQGNREKAKKASPLYYAGKDSAPFLIMHGDKDNLVPLKQSEVLADALAKAGVEVKLEVIKGYGHGGPGFNTADSRKLIEEFFDKHLKGKDGGKTGAVPSKSRVLVTISKETTYITGPLRKDGYVNYVAALNDRCKKGVTPENNAAVLFWQAMGPAAINADSRARYFQMLEVQPLPEKGDYFITFYDYVQRLKDAKDPRVPESTTDRPDPAWDQLTEASKRPWSKQEYPLLAGWLAANEKPLARLVEASKRPRRYDPLLFGHSDEGLALAALLPAANQFREPARALAARAMLHLKDDKLNAAWDDLLACHRLARLAGQGLTLIDALTALSIDGGACAGDQAMLQSDALSASQIAKMREDLARLPREPKMVDKLDVSERFIYLDGVASVAREGISSVSVLTGNPLAGGGKSKTLTELLMDDATRMAIDWNLILRMGNAWYDRLVAACRIPTRSKKWAELNKFDKDIKELTVDAKDPKSLGLALLTKSPREAVSQRIGNMFVGMFLPALSAAVNAEDRGTMQSEVTRLGFALAAYRADHGAYPKELAELTPKYVAKVPSDIFANDGPLHYKRQGTGYLLYSVGINGRDDGGRGYNDRKEGEDWDDLSIRVP
jgi:acetyl esterase/lipase